MKNKKYLFLIPVFILLSVFSYIYNKSTEIDITKTSTEIFINSEEIVELFVGKENKALSLFKNKVVEVTGKVKSVNFTNNKPNIILYSNYNNHNVICEMQIANTTKINKELTSKTITLKGICKGFLEDVIILNCTVLNIKDNE